MFFSKDEDRTGFDSREYKVTSLHEVLSQIDGLSLSGIQRVVSSLNLALTCMPGTTEELGSFEMDAMFGFCKHAAEKIEEIPSSIIISGGVEWMGLPSEIRKRFPQVKILFNLCSPWLCSERVRELPFSVLDRLIKSLLNADVLCFPSPESVAEFSKSVLHLNFTISTTPSESILSPFTTTNHTTRLLSTMRGPDLGVWCVMVRA